MFLVSDKSHSNKGEKDMLLSILDLVHISQIIMLNSLSYTDCPLAYLLFFLRMFSDYMPIFFQSDLFLLFSCLSFLHAVDINVTYLVSGSWPPRQCQPWVPCHGVYL